MQKKSKTFYRNQRSGRCAAVMKTTEDAEDAEKNGGKPRSGDIWLSPGRKPGVRAGNDLSPFRGGT